MKKPVILLIDNNEKFLQGRTEILEKAGYQVITANNPVDARQLVNAGGVDLLLTDIRLTDDDDPEDRGGLDLIHQSPPSLPKIIMTWYPTWQAVREAFGVTVDSMPPVVDFVQKEEVNRMLLAIDWTLNHARLKENLFQSFEARSLMALKEKWQDLDESETSRRLQTSLEKTTQEITVYREEANSRACQYHKWGLIAGVLSMGLILLAVGIVIFGNLGESLPAMLAGALSQAVSSLLYNREEAAHRRVATFFEQLEQVNQLQNLLLACDTFVDTQERDRYKGIIISRLTDKWFGSNGKAS